MEAPHEHPTDETPRLNLFCSREGDVWRLYFAPGPRPPFLDALLDDEGEAYPVMLDFEDLDRLVAARGASVERQWSRDGDVELTAQGASAMVLARWVANALASGVRP